MLEIKPMVKFNEAKDNRYGKLVIEPLERGYGTTLGNSLRRVLLSSLPGVAITHIKIESVRHEFSTIEGVVEDVTSIILNMKKIRFKVDTDKKKTLRLDASLKKDVIMERGGVVLAEDINPDAEVEILNKDQHIATLDSEGAELKMEMDIEVGRGYIPADRHETEEQILDRIPIDSIFSPIRKVNYIVEDTRVGQVTNYDKLVLELWTDGSVPPHEAVSKGAQILNSYLRYFVDLKPPEEPVEIEPEKKDDDILDKPIDELGLSVRSLNCLKRAGKKSLRDLRESEEQELMKLKNFGQKSLEEVKNIIDKFGFALNKPEEI
ncbi:MAG: DNA-directed RNA polymerase subunit alpha [Candidatus Eremiobacteraeota bacterium]|nr:DNA-directed RNA polymerase subunit alpha [Candidatus Eremiobacteraeota bacterium]